MEGDLPLSHSPIVVTMGKDWELAPAVASKENSSRPLCAGRGSLDYKINFMLCVNGAGESSARMGSRILWKHNLVDSTIGACLPIDTIIKVIFFP
jgi:hypothetical protein